MTMKPKSSIVSEDAPNAEALPPELPKGTMLWRINFASHPEAIVWRADEQSETATEESSPARSAPDFLVLCVPTDDLEPDPGDDDPRLGELRTWVEAGLLLDDQPSLLMTFQGACVLLSQRRCAILAPRDRLDALGKTIAEFARNDAELSAVERRIQSAWDDVEQDVPLAFEFNARSMTKQTRLRQRFQLALHDRSRLARLRGYVYSPYRHPATLADQMGERLRERTRMMHRYETVDEQLEVFERVYETGSQRAADFLLTRSGNTLEWIIIILLLTQILMSGFELLTSL